MEVGQGSVSQRTSFTANTPGRIPSVLLSREMLRGQHEERHEYPQITITKEVVDTPKSAPPSYTYPVDKKVPIVAETTKATATTMRNDSAQKLTPPAATSQLLAHPTASPILQAVQHSHTHHQQQQQQHFLAGLCSSLLPLSTVFVVCFFFFHFLFYLHVPGYKAEKWDYGYPCQFYLSLYCMK